MKLDSLKLRQHLRAISGCGDDGLKQNGLDPENLRKNFFVFFNKSYEEYSPQPDALKKMLSEELKDEYKSYKIYDLSRSYDQYIDRWTDGYCNDCYFFVGETQNCEFVTCDIEYETSTNPTVNRVLESGSWHIRSKQKANFIDVTVKYHQLIVSICDSWGYKTVVDWIKTNN
jgi:hypothetical protein